MNIHAENHEIRVQRVVDWEKGTLTLQMSLSFDLDQTLFPQARGTAEKKLEEALPRHFLDAVSSLVFTSSSRLGEYFSEQGRGDGRKDYLAALNTLAAQGEKILSVVSDDFRRLTVAYRYRFYGPRGIITPLVNHQLAFPLPEFPGYYPAGEYTGVVINARGKNLAFGKKTQVVCVPALKPRIFYLSARNTIEPVLEFNMVEPEILKSRGMLAYIRSAEPAACRERAGDHPLTITAYAVYGTNDTDIIISEDAARMLLSREANRQLLRQGRIVVIIDQSMRFE
jgi:hypothetical protein